MTHPKKVIKKLSKQTRNQFLEVVKRKEIIKAHREIIFGDYQDDVV